MASIARCRDALKSEPFHQSELVRGYLSQEDLTEAAAAANLSAGGRPTGPP
jgi:hypothetical protein